MAAFLFTLGKNSRKVDFIPSGGLGGRKMDIIIDSKFKISFGQDGNHFEIGDIDVGSSRKVTQVFLIK